MKIAAVNGSHKGKGGNTDIMVTAFLKGAAAAGAETANIILAEKEIKYCKACKACWFNTRGRCVLKDDMAGILPLLEDAAVWVWATPLYFDNISSLFKTFIDRLMVMGSPYWGIDQEGECRHLTAREMPKLIMLANCGFPERSHFQVISHWIQRHGRNLGTEIIAEIYASESALLNNPAAEAVTMIADYRRLLETAGREIATGLKLTADTKQRLEQPFIPAEVYIQRAKQYLDTLLQKSKTCS